MNVYVQTDIEGIAGNVFFENRKDAGIENVEHRQRMRRLLTAEVDAAVRASFDAGAGEVLVNDSHGSGYNILFEDLDPRCEIVHGRNCSGPHWLPEFDGHFDALILVGMHAMGGTEGALLSHSHWVIDGGRIHLSEAGMAAALAGDRGVPTVFVSGDQYVTAELREKVPGISAVIVKKSLGAYQARSAMPARACRMISDGVRAGLLARESIRPYRIPGPVRLNLLDSPNHAPPLMPLLQGDVVGDSVEEAFMQAVASFPWNPWNTRVPDGFVGP
jgi:D-amino peptidase